MQHVIGPYPLLFVREIGRADLFSRQPSRTKPSTLLDIGINCSRLSLSSEYSSAIYEKLAPACRVIMYVLCL